MLKLVKYEPKGRVGVNVQKTRRRGGKDRKKEVRRCSTARALGSGNNNPKADFALIFLRQQKSQLYSEKEKQLFFMHFQQPGA